MSSEAIQYVGVNPVMPVDLGTANQLRSDLIGVVNQYGLSDVAVAFFDSKNGALGKILTGFESVSLNDVISKSICECTIDAPVSFYEVSDNVLCSYFFEADTPGVRGGKSMFSVIANTSNLGEDFYKNLDLANSTNPLKIIMASVKASIKSVADSYVKLFETPEVSSYIAKNGLKALFCA